ncbi:MAG: hypothetical protein AB1546_12840 [bacterium]
MKTKTLILLFVFALFIPGCKGEKKTAAPVGEEQKPSTPAAVVEKLFQALQSGEEEDLTELFSAAIPSKIYIGFFSGFHRTKEIMRFRVTAKEEKENAATVTVKYIYFEKKPGEESGYESGKRKLGENKLTLVKKNNQWQIRLFGEKIDRKIEERLFYNCLNLVMDAEIAQETYHGAHSRYATTIAALEPIIPISADKCRELKIERADKNDYLLLATSPNLVPCPITATTDGTIPMKYEECPK